MTAKKMKKSRKLRGVRQHGYGKTHRGAGNRGGRGNAGSGKKADQKKPGFWHEKHFGKSGFKRSRVRKKQKVISLGILQDNIGDFLDKGLAKPDKDIIIVDLKKAGYVKLLGNGKLRQRINVLVPSASKKAVEKVAKLEGKIIVE